MNAPPGFNFNDLSSFWPDDDSFISPSVLNIYRDLIVPNGPNARLSPLILHLLLELENERLAGGPGSDMLHVYQDGTIVDPKAVDWTQRVWVMPRAVHIKKLLEEEIGDVTSGFGRFEIMKRELNFDDFVASFQDRMGLLSGEDMDLVLRRFMESGANAA
ncbi:hypothetical protein TWF696_008200 [Orbilia brochopaga]|uniref:Uncharacterized protein n=1 Tax=Orbilia brochopaga TaxID=3140254 RepID=A0AAV9UGL7_9PEZI